MRRSDLVSWVRGAERYGLDRLFEKRVLVDGGLRVKLYGRDGLVVYSNNHSLIGSHADDPSEMARVLAGATVKDISNINHEGGGTADVKTLEVYVPLLLSGTSYANGVFELYQSY